MHVREIEVASAAVAEACRLARSVQQRGIEGGDRVSKADSSPVTVADLAAQVVISHRLAEAFPGDSLVAEESSSCFDRPGAPGDLPRRVLELAGDVLPGLDHDAMMMALDRSGPGRRSSGRVWILDPIDGTKGFLRGGQYAVALALASSRRLEAAVLGCPNLPVTPGDEQGRLGILLAAVCGQGAWQTALDGGEPNPIAVSDNAEPEHAVLCESVESGHSSHELSGRVARRMGLERAPWRLDSQCKYALVARGEACLYLRLPRRQRPENSWDHAAGSLVVAEAGGRVSDLDGRPLDFSGGATVAVGHGILASNRLLHGAALSAARAELGLGGVAHEGES